MMEAVVTVIGADKVGIIAGITAILADNNVNILDISQTIMRDTFTMLMLVDIEKSAVSFAELEKKLDVFGKEKGLSVRLQRNEIFEAMHRI